MEYYLTYTPRTKKQVLLSFTCDHKPTVEEALQITKFDLEETNSRGNYIWKFEKFGVEKKMEIEKTEVKEVIIMPEKIAAYDRFQWRVTQNCDHFNLQRFSQLYGWVTLSSSCDKDEIVKLYDQIEEKKTEYC